MKSGIISGISLVALGSAAFAAPARAQSGPSVPAAPVATAPATGNADNVEIVVTAAKRSERLQDVSAAITALNADKLDELGIQHISDYLSNVPGFTFRDNGAPGFGTVILRGLNTGANQTANTTAFYFDETPLTANGSFSIGGLVTADPDISDVERIEVLKGPQGTLYGANSLGGLVRIISKQPDLTRFSGSARVDTSVVDGGSVGYGGKLSVNIPLVTDSLAVTASGVYHHTPGWTTNVGTGTRNANQGESYGGRVSILWKPAPELKFHVTGTYQENTSNGWNLTQSLTDTTTPTYGRYDYNFVLDQGILARYATAEAGAEYKTDAGTLIANGSYAHYAVQAFQDYTRNYGVLLGGAFGPIAVPTYATPREDKYSGDLRFVSRRFGPIEFIAGGFYTYEKTSYHSRLDVLSQPSKAPLPAPYNSFVSDFIDGSYEEISAYGDITAYLTDNFDITGGVRYSHNIQKYDTYGIIFFVSSPLSYYPQVREGRESYLATARYRFGKNLSAYFRAASGYRPSSPNTSSQPQFPPIVDHDNVWNYELGLKGATDDHVLSGTIAAYHIDWTKVQLTGLGTNGLAFLLNGGNAYVNGLELEATLRPVTGLAISGDFAYTYSKFTSVDPAATASTGVQVGSHLPLTPEVVGAVTADYGFDIAHSARLTFGSTFKYTGVDHSSFTADAGTNPDLRLPAYATLDIRAVLDYGRYNATLRVENLTNTYGLATAATTKVFPGEPGVDTLLTPTRPRTFELSLGVKF